MQTTFSDLPADLVLDFILSKLSPADLCTMSCTNRALRDMAGSDDLWARHFSEKWCSVIGLAAFREWDWFKPRAGSIKELYIDLECGRLWFSAQLFNPQIEHTKDVAVAVECMLTSYNVELKYDRHTDTFTARYPIFCECEHNHDIEEGVLWERLRVPPVDTPSHSLHDSNCLNELRPGDHIEIQWKSDIESPYGWWYGVVGHLDTCDGNEHSCYCHNTDDVVIKFNQLTDNGKWGIFINRNDHWESEAEKCGIFGGIRKLQQQEEISAWKEARRPWSAEFFQ